MPYADPAVRRAYLRRRYAETRTQKLTYQRAYSAANRAKISERSKRQYDTAKAWLREYKLSRGCLDCGFNAHPDALHFDHRDPSTKTFTIGRGSTSSQTRLLTEIAKCDIRCANCHAIRTAAQRTRND